MNRSTSNFNMFLGHLKYRWLKQEMLKFPPQAKNGVKISHLKTELTKKCSLMRGKYIGKKNGHKKFYKKMISLHNKNSNLL